MIVRKPLLVAAFCLFGGAAAAAGTGDAGPGSGSELESVVVTATRATTATKTDTALVETPQAISVITAAQFTDRSALTMQETLRYSAGVTSEAFGLDTRSDQPVVRGFYSVQYLDGMTKLFGYSLIPRADVYTLERIELLRGPSSALYGKGNAGGVTNLVSKRPLFDRQRELGVQFDSYNRRQVQVDLTGPFDEAGTLAARVVGVARDSEMQTDQISDDRLLVAPSLTWQPSERTRLTLLTLFQDDETASSQQFLPVAATLFAPPGRRIDDSTFLGEPEFDKLDTRQSQATLLLEHEITDALGLNSSVRYTDARAAFNEIYPDVYTNPADPFIDAANRQVGRFSYSIRSRTRFLTSDNHVQYAFGTGGLEHKVLAGVDYQSFRERSESGSGEVAPIDIYAPVYGNFTAPELGPTSTLDQYQLGFYLQDQIRYDERVSVVLGLRRDRARSKVDAGEAQIDHETTFRAGLIVDAGAGFSPYVSYSESFLPTVGLDFYGRAFIPQRGRQYEAGVKWQPARHTLVTLNGFRITERNRQTNDPDNVLNTIQTGEVRSQGAELEATIDAGNDFMLTAALSYIDAEVTRSTFAPEVGVQLSDTPKEQASLWGVKALPIGSDLSLRLGGGVRYIGSTLSTGVSGSITTPSYTLADALLALDAPSWTLTANATNLFDKSYYAPCRAFGDCFTGNRRSIIGTLTYRF